MKTQQRNFIVEIKGKRRSAVSPKSIWGGTDIGALVREVRADAPHLFISKDSKTGEDQPVTEDAAPAKTDLEGREKLGFQHAEPGEAPSAAFVVDPPQDQGSYLPNRLSESVQIQKSEPRLSLTHKSERPHPTAVKLVEREDVSEDELQSLHEENRRLVAALIKKLHDENERLSMMLSRFEVDE